MKTLSILVTVGMAAAAASAQPQWYNGDPDNENGIFAEYGGQYGATFLYEDFDFDGGTIESLSGNYYIGTTVTGYAWEIRSEMSDGSGGTLLFAGNTDGPWSMERNYFDNSGYLGYSVIADIDDVFLPAGSYMMALSLIGDGQGTGNFLQTTSGANGFGSPIDNDLNWFTSEFFGVSYFENYLPGSDFSYGVSIPAPASVALLGLGGLVAARRRR